MSAESRAELWIVLWSLIPEEATLREEVSMAAGLALRIVRLSMVLAVGFDGRDIIIECFKANLGISYNGL